MTPELQNNDIDTFVQEVKQPTIPAMDGPGAFVPPSVANGPAAQPNLGPQYTPPEGAKPIFNTEDMGGEGEEEEKERPISTEYERNVIMGIIGMEDKLTSGLGMLIAKHDSPKPFEISDDDKEDLFESIHPDLRDWIVKKCPAWLPMLVGYGLVKIKQSGKVMKYRKMNEANKAAANDTSVMDRVRTATSTPGKRSNYMLYIDGYYRSDAKGTYLKRTDPVSAAKLERPAIADLDKILAVPANCKKDLLAAAFGWTAADCAKHGITE